MAQIIQGTISVTNGNNVISGSGTNWRQDDIPAGSFIVAGSDEVAYTVSSVNEGAQQITITGNYGGITRSGISYTLHIDLYKSLPIYTQNDANTPELMNETTKVVGDTKAKIDNIILQGTVGVYTSTANGIAATDDGEYFFVAGAENVLELYLNNSGTADLAGTYPLLENIQDAVDDALATIQQQQDDFEAEFAAKNVRLSRSLSVDPDIGETLRIDNLRDGHGVGSVLDGGLTDALAFDELMTVTRSTPKTYVNALGEIATAAANTLPVSYDPVTLRPVGRINEEERTNLIRFSELFDDSIWTKESGVTVSGASVTFPTSDTFTNVSVAGSRLRQSIGTHPVGTIHTYTVIVPPISNWSDTTAQIRVGFATSGTPAGIVVTPTNNTQYITDSFTVGVGTSSQNIAIKADRPVTIDGLKFQVEQGATATSYIPTEGSQVSRAATQVSISLS